MTIETEPNLPARVEQEVIDFILSPIAVRERCEMIYDLVASGGSAHFVLRPEKLAATASYVLQTMRENYPTLDIPVHSRWRHFSSSQLAMVDAALANVSPRERTRAKIELAITSVLLDAGAGERWSFTDPFSGEVSTRSEGLAAASLHLFLNGGLSSDSANPARADAVGLASLTEQKLSAAFQVSGSNPLLGVGGRLSLIRNLGFQVGHAPAYFGATSPRLGNLFDYIETLAQQGSIPATTLLRTILSALGPLWPGRLALGGTNLGDTWKHEGVVVNGATNGLVPFHKLSQWLTYSLFEPLEESGLKVIERNELTALAEYRNGGLILDMGLVELRDPRVTEQVHAPSSALIIEWRALTVTLLDRIAQKIRAELGLSADDLPLANVLEGGTWAAGRKIAREKRAGGVPPLTLESDGTVF